MDYNIPDMSMVLTTIQHENLELGPSGMTVPLDSQFNGYQIFF